MGEGRPYRVRIDEHLPAIATAERRCHSNVHPAATAQAACLLEDRQLLHRPAHAF
jgi:hypothetical protein